MYNLVLCDSSVLHVLNFYINDIIKYVFSYLLLFSVNIISESSMLIQFGFISLTFTYI